MGFKFKKVTTETCWKKDEAAILPLKSEKRNSIENALYRHR